MISKKGFTVYVVYNRSDPIMNNHVILLSSGFFHFNTLYLGTGILLNEHFFVRLPLCLFKNCYWIFILGILGLSAVIRVESVMFSILIRLKEGDGRAKDKMELTTCQHFKLSAKLFQQLWTFSLKYSIHVILVDFL